LGVDTGLTSSRPRLLSAPRFLAIGKETHATLINDLLAFADREAFSFFTRSEGIRAQEMAFQIPFGAFLDDYAC